MNSSPLPGICTSIMHKFMHKQANKHTNPFNGISTTQEITHGGQLQMLKDKVGSERGWGRWGWWGVGAKLGSNCGNNVCVGGVNHSNPK